MRTTSGYYITVGLIADPKGLSINIAEKLLARGNSVEIFTDYKNEWEKSCPNLVNNKSFKILSVKDLNESRVSHLIYVSNFVEKGVRQDTNLVSKRDIEVVNVINSALSSRQLRVFMVYPYVTDSRTKILLRKNISSIKKYEVVGIYLVGDLIGPRISLTSDGFVSKVINDVVSRGEVKAPTREMDIYLTSVSDAANVIARSLFSFGPYSNERILLTGEVINISQFLELLYGARSEVSFSYDNKEWDRKRLRINKRFVIKFDQGKVLSEAIKWGKSHISNVEDNLEVKEISQVNTTKKSSEGYVDKSEQESKWNLFNRRLLIPLFLLMLIIVSPIVTLSLSGALLALGLKSLSVGQIGVSEKALLVAERTSEVSEDQWRFITFLPVSNQYFKSGYEAAKSVKLLSNTSQRLVAVTPEIIGSINYLMSSSGNKRVIDNDSIALELGEIYNELGFLEGELEESRGLVKSAYKGIGEGKIERLMQYALLGNKMFEQMDELSGVGGERKYLILLQNNMELRPTGGFIGSVALVHFVNGTLNDFDVLDVYSVDGGLKGYIEPPGPIEKYLSEATWYLRDSNWNPDFPTSADRAEWFLDKSLDVQVDGVVAVDLELAKSLLEILGPIEVADFGEVVSEDNLYSVTQRQAEEDFFPGSRKKANFLTALTRGVFAGIQELEAGDYLNVLKAISDDFDEKHILVNLHNQEVQKQVANLNWDGGVSNEECLGNCYSDFVGIVDSNLGVNKANYYIDRSANLTVDVSESINRKLDIFITNKANSSKGEEAEYKSYVRIIVPEENVFGRVTIHSGSDTLLQKPDVKIAGGYKEAGVFVEVKPGKTAAISFIWEGESELDFSMSGRYKFLWRKQPGTYGDNIIARFAFPIEANMNAIPNPSLTQGGMLGYNTRLITDLKSVFFW